MLAGKRAVRVGDQIQKEISYLLLERVKDPRVRGVTVTGINLSNDLKRARVFFSVIGEQDHIKRAQAGLDSAKGFIKREIGSRMSLRYTPEIIFMYDPSLESGSHMESVFEELKYNESENDAE
ncbi:MAG: 30S ribosome-binding factor RbfA [Deltaproteobacteria bacterium]|nr:30S ribosome-binding factor RbfA [Deltaproteobacteria bacterium]MBW2143183.1 30S ribosome-binding factor RbfA [Deltaproteobacteria bacterium]